MMGSLFTGLTGVHAHQTKLEVTGNNIANANTVAYKAGRTTFSDLFYSMLDPATEQTQPMQRGHGVQVASIDTLYRQGGYQDSGIETDFAVSGDGFFMVQDPFNSIEYYTRAGNFHLNQNGELVTIDGYHVQGINAVNGSIPEGGGLSTITIDFDPIAPVATSQIGMRGNLDAGMSVFATTNGSDPVHVGGFDNIVGTRIAGTITLFDDETTIALQGEGTQFTSLNVGDELVIEGRVYSIASIADDLNLTLDRPIPTGTIQAVADTNLILGSGTAFSQDFRIGDIISFGGVTGEVISVEDDSQLRIARPVSIDVPAGSTIDLVQAASIAGDTATTTTPPNSDTQLFQLPDSEFPIAANETARVLVRDESTGQLVQVSLTGRDTLGDLEAAVQNAGMTNYSLNDENFRVSKLHRDNLVTTSFRAIDSEGLTHHILFEFVKTDDPNAWTWKATLSDTSAALDMNTAQGQVTFDENGIISGFTNLNGDSEWTLAIDAGDADTVQIEMDLDVVSNINQFNLGSDLAVTENNGSFSGVFQTFTLEPDGTMIGSYSNGETREVAKIMLADFQNTGGLQRAGSNLFRSTTNSGDAIVRSANLDGMGVLTNGTLETSNVSLADEFTDLILSQRGFQANANVITTTDSLLQEALSIKRL